ncbi:RHS repeat-associated core domain-containing protein, partial [Pseudomonas poae]|uniref:RHS repeat-associated core domain-containing protein n=1 Tax=Pseudomonas poae TaxID=200451 RepID=UPI0034D59189
QGQYFDQESGLHYNRHRYYNPDVGRYLTPDPVKLAGGINAYQYVPNPTGWVDPLGLSSCPGDDGCKPTARLENPIGKAKVNERLPTLPMPAGKERRARIDELTEENAKQRVMEIEKKI